MRFCEGAPSVRHSSLASNEGSPPSFDLPLSSSISRFQMSGRPTRSRKLPVAQQEQQTRAKWTSYLTKVLADLMVDQVHKGNRPKNNFKKKAWSYICNEFYRRTGMRWDIEQLRSRYVGMRKQYLSVKPIIDQSDFSWDEASGAIMAKDDVWDNYIKEYPDAETLRISGCPIYKQLCTIFSDSAMEGSTEYNEGKNENENEENSSSDSDEAADAAVIEHDKFLASALSNNRKRGRKGFDDLIADAICQMAAAARLRAEALNKYNQKYNQKFSITNCMKVLDEINDVDEGVYHAALDLFENCVAREIFLSLRADKRLMWLQNKCKLPCHHKVEE